VREEDQHWRIRFRHWRYKIDRTTQNGLRKDAVDGLLASKSRRVEVVLLAGPAAAGLGYFRERRLEVDTTVHQESWAPAWSPSPGQTLDELCKCYSARSPKQLAAKLTALRSGGKATVVHVSHEVTTAEALPHEALGAYLDALGGLAAALPATHRVVVSVYVETEAATRRRGGGWCCCSTRSTRRRATCPTTC